MDQAQKDSLARALGISPEEQALLDKGGDHRYGCRCNDCLAWWCLMGPEDPDGPQGPHSYGPFTAAEIKAALERGVGR